MTNRPIKVSLFLPVYNEEVNLELLHEKIIASLSRLGHEYEVIYVDDRSTDRSLELLTRFAANDARVRVISFRRNYGQTAAMSAGIDAARGEVLIPMDADLQNDPADIERLLAKLDEGYDVVSGWRQERRDTLFTRVLPSRIANWLISKISGVRLHDYGCSLKAYRREALKDVHLYGEMHRFIPAHAHANGARVTEIEVRYHPRRFGKSNYGISRTFRVLLDLLLIRFLDKYMDRPMHFFGGFGFLLLFLGFVAGMSAVVLRLFWDLHLVQTPLPTFSALLLIMGLNLAMLGVLSEVMMRIYYETKDTKPYHIKEKINI